MTNPSSPAWLPDIAEVNGEWSQVLVMLYRIFESDIKQSGLALNGLPVWWDRTIVPGEVYEEGFWHLITRDDRQQSCRLPDFARAKRLPWCGPSISNVTDPIIKIWDYREANRKIRTYIWLENWDYVVILEKKQKRSGMVAFLVTAYHVDGESRRHSFRRKYENREP